MGKWLDGLLSHVGFMGQGLFGWQENGGEEKRRGKGKNTWGQTFTPQFFLVYVLTLVSYFWSSPGIHGARNFDEFYS